MDRNGEASATASGMAASSASAHVFDDAIGAGQAVPEADTVASQEHVAAARGREQEGLRVVRHIGLKVVPQVVKRMCGGTTTTRPPSQTLGGPHGTGHRGSAPAERPKGDGRPPPNP